MDVELAINSFRYDNIEGWFEMIVKASEFPSVNNMYGINRKTKAIYTLPHVEKFQGELKDQIIFTDPKKYCPWISEYNVYYIHFTFILNHGFWKRDLDNLLKSPIDVVFQGLGINDARIIEHHNFKTYRPGETEALILRVGLSNYKYNQFNK